MEVLAAPMEMKTIVLDGKHLSLEQLVQVARHHPVKIDISGRSIERMQQSRNWVEQVEKSGEPVVYGVNTGFGSKATVSIPPAKLEELQRNLIVSHSAGAGDPLDPEIVRAAMLLRANTLVNGYSGIRIEVVKTLLQMLEKGVVPWIPRQGSLGASGDLAPLSHLALVLSRPKVGDPEEQSGKAYLVDPENPERMILMSGKEAMQKAGIGRVVLQAKEGLALNNGTQVSTALLALALYDARKLVKMADIAMAMSLEALHGISAAFREELHQLRPHPGQLQTAENIRRLTAGSKLLDRQNSKVQDAYSLRCHPQVLAGVRDTLSHLERVVEVEMNATTDNPVIFPELDETNKAVSGGNFHAQPIAFGADFLSIVLCEVGNIAERRIFRLSDHNLNGGLPSFLIDRPGLESGLMIAQYTAASLVSENKSFAHPASIDSIPSCENQEDHVSMAPVAGRKALHILENVQKIIAIELIYAAQGLDMRLQKYHGDKKEAEQLLGRGTVAAFRKLREHVDYVSADRPIYLDIEQGHQLVKNCQLLEAVEAAVGPLH